MSTQLASQTQARLNIGEKLDLAQAVSNSVATLGSLVLSHARIQAAKHAESDLQTARARVAELEQRLNKDQRSMLASENQYRDQLTERNTLLLTIYQYLEKILGVDKTPVSNHANLDDFVFNFLVICIEKGLCVRNQTIHQLQRFPR